MKNIYIALGTLVVLLFFSVNSIAQKNKPNVLFIAIDDLKPILGCYGNTLIKTPNIDRLAKMGTVFKSNYVQQAVCGPTRASILTGKRPDYTKVWDLKTKMRDINPTIISLPQYFISKGYSTQGIGKVYDPRCVDKELDEPSWSVPYYKNAKKYYGVYGEPALGRYQLPETKLLVEKYFNEATAKGDSKAEANDYVQTKIKPSVENADVPDYAYTDGANTLKAKDVLVQLSKKSEPFFFAVGISKPHLPFVAPQKYWDMYKREDMPIAPFQEQPKNAVKVSMHNAGEISVYSDIAALSSYSDQKDYGLSLPIDKQKELIHGYYAAISYADACVGVLLNTLDSLGLTKNTIIVLWGDHGWHLGDHNLWCKHTNFEEATHAPLIIAAPGMVANTTESQSEHIDIFPTLCDLAGIAMPNFIDGKSLKPLMKNAKAIVKEFSVSQYPRSNATAENETVGKNNTNAMGYSIRTKQYRYTIWMSNGFRSSQAFNKDLIIGTELYDYKNDPNETINVTNEKKYAVINIDMHKKMLAFFKTQEVK
jgi:iduronate 2-sulfatase